MEGEDGMGWDGMGWDVMGWDGDGREKKRANRGGAHMTRQDGETRHVCRELDKGKGGGKEGETGRTGTGRGGVTPLWGG